MKNTLDDLKNELAFQRQRPGSAAAGLEWAVAEIEQLRTALKDCADDLEAEVEARYSHGIKEHPAMTPKYERDMEPVVNARRLLTEV